MFENQTNRTSATGSGLVGQAIPFSFPINATSDVVCHSRVTASGVEDTLTEITDYTVAITGDTGGTVTTVTVVPVTSQIHIVRVTPKKQTLDLEHGGTFSAENVEDAFDTQTRIAIDAHGKADRSIRFPETDPTSSIGDTPSSIDRSERMAGYNADGKPVVSTSTVSEIDATVGGVVSSTGVLSTVYQFTGNGSTVAFTLTGGLTSIPNAAAVIVDIDGITQHADTYTVSGLVVTFGVAPPNLSDIQVRYNAYLGSTGTVAHSAFGAEWAGLTLPYYFVSEASVANDLDVLINTDMNGITEAVVFMDADCTASANITTGAGIYWMHVPGAVATINTGTVTTINSPQHLIGPQQSQWFACSATNDLEFTKPGTVMPDIFGTDGTADEVQINYALDSLPSNAGSAPHGSPNEQGFGGTVQLIGLYDIANAISIKDGVTLQGSGPYGAHIYNSNTSAGNAIEITTTSKYFTTLKDFTVKGNSSSGAGIFVDQNQYMRVSRLLVQGHGTDGVLINETTVGGSWRDVYCITNGGWGMQVIDSGTSNSNTAMVFDMCNFNTNGSGGVHLYRADGIQFRSCVIETNDNIGMKVDGTHCILDGLWFEANGGGQKVITGITRANPAVVTVTLGALDDYETGQRLSIWNVSGMTEINDTSYVITRINDTSFSLDGINSTGYTTYTSGGKAAPVGLKIAEETSGSSFENILMGCKFVQCTLEFGTNATSNVVFAPRFGNSTPNPKIFCAASATSNQIIGTMNQSAFTNEGPLTRFDATQIDTAKLNIGSLTMQSRIMTVLTGGGYNIALGTSSGDNFTVDTNSLTVKGDTKATELGANGTVQGKLIAWDGAGGVLPAYIQLHSPNGTARFLFVEDDGTLKTHTVAPTQNSDGTVIGAQS